MKTTKTAKTTTKKTTKSSKGRGGRTPGVWRDGLSGDAMRQYRKTNRISRSKMGKLLGVSSTTIQNWEVGVAVPTPKNQTELERVLNGAAPAKSVESEKSSVRQTPFAHGDHHGVELTTTGQIVSAWLNSPKVKGGVTKDDLVGVVRSVRSALA